MLGLPKLSRLYEGDPGPTPPATTGLAAKVEYVYDEGSTYLQAMPAAATQHDAAHGGSTRGNVTRVRRYDVSGSSYVENQSGYNTAGAVIFTRNALNYQTSISYSDAFSDNVNRNTFAYPTTVTDPGGYSSTMQYNFDFGALTRTQDPKGAAFSREYDWAGRQTRQTNLVNQAHTRYFYAPSHNYVQSWTTVNDLTTANEFYSITLFDGANRVRATVEDHPGSVGGQRSVYNVYDAANRNTSAAGGVASYFVTNHQFDGDGQVAKRDYLYRYSEPATYYLRSSVLGGKAIAEIEVMPTGNPSKAT